MSGLSAGPREGTPGTLGALGLAARSVQNRGLRIVEAALCSATLPASQRVGWGGREELSTLSLPGKSDSSFQLSLLRRIVEQKEMDYFCKN